MKYVKKSDKSNELVFELEGEDDTFSGLLVAKLLEDSNVEEANYHIPHPLVGSPEFYIKTKKGTPKDALKKALKSLKKDMDSLL